MASGGVVLAAVVATAGCIVVAVVVVVGVAVVTVAVAVAGVVVLTVVLAGTGDVVAGSATDKTRTRPNTPRSAITYHCCFKNGPQVARENAAMPATMTSTGLHNLATLSQ